MPKLRELALANCGTVEKREVLRKELAQLSPEELSFLVTRQLRCVGRGRAGRWVVRLPAPYDIIAQQLLVSLFHPLHPPNQT